MTEQHDLGAARTAALAGSDNVLRTGNTNCGGCGMSLALRMLGRSIGERRVQMVIPACCGIVTPGKYPDSAYGVPVVASTFASAAAVASGMARTAQMNHEDTRVICFAGDGGTYDIGMATISAAAERNEDLLFICYDNEIYGNTGGQRSSATPPGATTSTTPRGEDRPKKDILMILAAHRIPYAATVSLAHAADSVRKFDEALTAKGFRFLHVLSPCPTGWKSEPADGVELVRLAVRSGLFPVVEIHDGRRAVVNVEADMSDEALQAYFELQGRFRKNAVDLDAVRESIQASWQLLRRMQDPAPGALAEEVGEDAVPCNRTGRAFDPTEHVRCPYCFGDEAAVKAGQHAEFCDFRPGVDPVSFGFPDETSRSTEG
jgi:pyruvate ferredoxin oxidoreductase beta subunit/2-oxoisovalerate ferredoxin oxidoreductase beta subunit